MESTVYNFTVTSDQVHDNTVTSSMHAIYPFSTVLTCAEVICREIRLETTTAIITIHLQTTYHHVGFIPLYVQKDVVFTRCPNGSFFHFSPISFSLNFTGIYHIMSRFGVANDCSTTGTISREIDEALASITSQNIGVTQVKIWKITTKVYEIDTESEKFLIDRYYSVPADDDDSPVIDLLRYNSNGSKGCVICMEDYIEGSIVIKLPCDHDFHAVCIDRWSQIRQLCPLCRLQISPSSSCSFFLWILDL